MTKSLRILVVEDTAKHIEAAKVLLSDHELTIATGYDQAKQMLDDKHFDVVLTDLKIPKGGHDMMSSEGAKLADSQGDVPYGGYIIFYAIQEDIKYLGLLCWGKHHDDPFVFALDGLSGFNKGDTNVIISNRAHEYQTTIQLEGEEVWVKDWGKMLEELNPQSDPTKVGGKESFDPNKLSSSDR